MELLLLALLGTGSTNVTRDFAFGGEVLSGWTSFLVETPWESIGFANCQPSTVMGAAGGGFA